MRTSAIVLSTVAAVGGATAIGFAAFVWSGHYNIAADDPHTKMISSLMGALRERSIEMRSRGLPIPGLNDPKMVVRGAALYSEMCVSCHLAPGIDESELHVGLYPQPPNLAKHGAHDPAEAFWIVKHGIKMSGMPAWGASHDNAALWDVVAFLRAMQTMSPAQYKQLVKQSSPQGK